MVKKMKLPFPFKNTDTITSSWPWPSCGSPKTLSFRAGNDVLKSSVNSGSEVCPADTVEDTGGESIETMIRGLWSERLFFEPVETSSILEVVKTDEFPFKESTEIMAVESRDPYVDFKKSMEEMVEAHGLKDWECLEELLSCYLRVNGKSNHGYIVVAFVDLLVSLAFASASASASSSNGDDDHSTSTTTRSLTTSPFSFSSSTSSTNPCLSSLLEVEDEIEKTVDNASSSSSSCSCSCSSSSHV